MLWSTALQLTVIIPTKAIIARVFFFSFSKIEKFRVHNIDCNAQKLLFVQHTPIAAIRVRRSQAWTSCYGHGLPSEWRHDYDGE